MDWAKNQLQGCMTQKRRKWSSLPHTSPLRERRWVQSGIPFPFHICEGPLWKEDWGSRHSQGQLWEWQGAAANPYWGKQVSTSTAPENRRPLLSPCSWTATEEGPIAAEGSCPGYTCSLTVTRDTARTFICQNEVRTESEEVDEKHMRHTVHHEMSTGTTFFASRASVWKNSRRVLVSYNRHILTDFKCTHFWLKEESWHRTVSGFPHLLVSLAVYMCSHLKWMWKKGFWL